MAAVPITIVGILTTESGSTQATMVGMASRSDLAPEHPIVIPKPPVDPGLHPEHPIYYPPGSLPHPEHPIVLPPDPPIDPPTEPPTRPPSDNWVWGYSPKYGTWTPVYVPEPGVDPGPKA